MPFDTFVAAAATRSTGAHLIDKTENVLQMRLPSIYKGRSHLLYCQLGQEEDSLHSSICFIDYTFPLTRKEELAQWVAETGKEHLGQALVPGSKDERKCLGSLHIGSTPDECMVVVVFAHKPASMFLASAPLLRDFLERLTAEADMLLPLIDLKHRGYSLNSAIMAHAYGAPSQLCRA